MTNLTPHLIHQQLQHPPHSKASAPLLQQSKTLTQWPLPHDPLNSIPYPPAIPTPATLESICGVTPTEEDAYTAWQLTHSLYNPILPQPITPTYSMPPTFPVLSNQEQTQLQAQLDETDETDGATNLEQTYCPHCSENGEYIKLTKLIPHDEGNTYSFELTSIHARSMTQWNHYKTLIRSSINEKTNDLYNIVLVLTKALENEESNNSPLNENGSTTEISKHSIPKQNQAIIDILSTYLADELIEELSKKPTKSTKIQKISDILFSNNSCTAFQCLLTLKSHSSILSPYFNPALKPIRQKEQSLQPFAMAEPNQASLLIEQQWNELLAITPTTTNNTIQQYTECLDNKAEIPMLLNDSQNFHNAVQQLENAVKNCKKTDKSHAIYVALEFDEYGKIISNTKNTHFTIKAAKVEQKALDRILLKFKKINESPHKVGYTVVTLIQNSQATTSHHEISEDLLDHYLDQLPYQQLTSIKESLIILSGIITFNNICASIKRHEIQKTQEQKAKTTLNLFESTRGIRKNEKFKFLLTLIHQKCSPYINNAHRTTPNYPHKKTIASLGSENGTIKEILTSQSTFRTTKDNRVESVDLLRTIQALKKENGWLQSPLLPRKNKLYLLSLPVKLTFQSANELRSQLNKTPLSIIELDSKFIDEWNNLIWMKSHKSTTRDFIIGILKFLLPKESLNIDTKDDTSVQKLITNNKAFLEWQLIHLVGAKLASHLNLTFLQDSAPHSATSRSFLNPQLLYFVSMALINNSLTAMLDNNKYMSMHEFESILSHWYSIATLVFLLKEWRLPSKKETDELESHKSVIKRKARMQDGYSKRQKVATL